MIHIDHATHKIARTRVFDLFQVNVRLDSLARLTLAILLISIAIVVAMLTVFHVDDLRGALWGALCAINSLVYLTIQLWESAIECIALILRRVARALVSGFKRGYSA